MLYDVDKVGKHVKGVFDQCDAAELEYKVKEKNNHPAETTARTCLTACVQDLNYVRIYRIELNEMINEMINTNHSYQLRWEMTCNTRLRILRYTV